MHPLPPLGGGAHKTRSKRQPPPEFQPNVALKSPDESAALMEVKQTLGTLTTALATMATWVEQLSQGKASQVATMSAQPGTRAGGNSAATPSQMALMSAQPETRTRLGATPLPLLAPPRIQSQSNTSGIWLSTG